MGRTGIIASDSSAQWARSLHLAQRRVRADGQRLGQDHLARCKILLGDTQSALSWLRQAVAVAPEDPDAWSELATQLYHASDWNGCYGAISRALALPTGPGASPAELGLAHRDLHEIAAICAGHLGLTAAAAHAAWPEAL